MCEAPISPDNLLCLDYRDIWHLPYFDFCIANRCNDRPLRLFMHLLCNARGGTPSQGLLASHTTRPLYPHCCHSAGTLYSPGAEVDFSQSVRDQLCRPPTHWKTTF